MSRARSLYKQRSLWFGLLFAAVPFVLAAAPAQAQSPSRKVKDMERAAKMACSAGDYQKGVQILAELFVDTSDPVYVHNQGRCYQQNGRCEQAVPRFREYLRKAANLSAHERTTVEGYIAECEAQMGQQPMPAATPVAPAATPLAPAVTPVAPVATPSAPVTTMPAPAESAPSPGRGLRMGGLITAGAGVALLGTGLIFNLAANSLVNEMHDGGYTPDKKSTSDSYKTLGWIGYGAGAAAVATGAVLYVLGSLDSSAGQVAVAPVLAPNAAGLQIGGTF